MIAELKRRKVFRIGVAYLVAGWLVIQVAATVAPQFGMLDWTPRLVTFLVMLGFPLALVLAWALEFGEHGVRVDRAGAGSKRFYIAAVVMMVPAIGWYWRGASTSHSPAVDQVARQLSGNDGHFRSVGPVSPDQAAIVRRHLDIGHQRQSRPSRQCLHSLQVADATARIVQPQLRVEVDVAGR